jgi:acetamidase/formamidase
VLRSAAVCDSRPYPGADDIRDVDLTKAHNLSGPIAVEGAEPGDCLVVDILEGSKNPVRFERCLY